MLMIREYKTEVTVAKTTFCCKQMYLFYAQCGSPSFRDFVLRLSMTPLDNSLFVITRDTARYALLENR